MISFSDAALTLGVKEENLWWLLDYHRADDDPTTTSAQYFIIRRKELDASQELRALAYWFCRRVVDMRHAQTMLVMDLTKKRLIQLARDLINWQSQGYEVLRENFGRQQISLIDGHWVTWTGSPLYHSVSFPGNCTPELKRPPVFVQTLGLQVAHDALLKGHSDVFRSTKNRF